MIRKHFRSVKEAVDAIQADVKRMELTLRKEAESAAAAILFEARNKAPRAFGDLRRSGHVESTSKRVRVVFDAPYARFVERGTRPHAPPIAPLVKWAMQKFLIDEREAKGIAFAIRKKIESEGTEPTHFLFHAAEAVRSRFRGYVRKAIEDAIK